MSCRTLWFALYLPDLPLLGYTRGCAAEPCLAVVAGHPRPRVIAATALAQASGVTPGKNVRTAQSLAPELLLRPRDPKLEADLLLELAHWASSFSPNVSLNPPRHVLVEAGASLRLFGGPLRLLERMHRESQELGLPTQLAAAPTPLAALWFSCSTPGHVHAEADWQKHLDTLPTQVLAQANSLDMETLELLLGLGMNKIGDIDSVSRTTLANRDVSQVTALLARARARQPDPRPWYRPPERYQAHFILPAPATSSDTLMFASTRLLRGLRNWLNRHYAAIDHCRLILQHENNTSSVLDIVTGKPANDEKHLLSLLRERLFSFAVPAPVEAMHIQAACPKLRVQESTDLFPTENRSSDQHTRLIERLQARLGDACLERPKNLAAHTPERSISGTSARLSSDRGKGPQQFRPRPLWLLQEPVPIETLSTLQVVRGPERIENGWWHGLAANRDYYVAWDLQGQLCWTYRNRDTQNDWFIHGYF